MRPYTRSLDPADFEYLEPYMYSLDAFERSLREAFIPYRKDHHFRTWEYTSILQQLHELGVPSNATILDTGSGASYFPVYLRMTGFDQITVSDSMAYGDCAPLHEQQCSALGITIPLAVVSVEQLRAAFPPGTFDVTMCVSVIEHVAADLYEEALQQLWAVTKPGGYIFLTSDYFRNAEQAEHSPFKQIQHTCFTEPLVAAIPNIIDVEFVRNDKGFTDLAYRGDFVNNYSFVNMCFRKR